MNFNPGPTTNSLFQDNVVGGCRKRSQLLREREYQSYFSTNQSSEKLTALQLFWQNSSVITNSWTKCFETSLKSQIDLIHKYIFMNGKSHYRVFSKNHAAVTPELLWIDWEKLILIFGFSTNFTLNTYVNLCRKRLEILGNNKTQ